MIGPAAGRVLLLVLLARALWVMSGRFVRRVSRKFQPEAVVPREAPPREDRGPGLGVAMFSKVSWRLVLADPESGLDWSALV
jgi:hypothetical protein